MDFGFDFFLLVQQSQCDCAVTNLETTLRISDAVILPFAFVPRIARCFPLLYAPKEGLKSKFNATGNILQNLTVNGFKFGVVFLPLRQRRSLSVERRRLQSLLMQSRSLMYHAVVNKTADSQRLIECGLLCFAWIQSMFIANGVHIFIILLIATYCYKHNTLIWKLRKVSALISP